jgi:hypothetical protein
MKVIQAQIENLEEIATLFDLCRVFYQQSSDIEAARNFIQDRFQQCDSTILVAIDNGQAIGFTQLYPSYSSVSMKRIWILNDLFVREIERKKNT